jgi:beta-aspartyl-peptidase (threonine type)
LADDKKEGNVSGCARAAVAASEILAGGGSALDAVERAVMILEDDDRFNAGTGACLNANGDLELDASIMDGADLTAGAVCALPPFKNPILIARRALDDGAHILYTSEGAAAFARAKGFTPAKAEEMITKAAKDRLEAAKKAGDAPNWAGGTVGAVARDAWGHVAAATSTGGRVNKAVGRVGDTPILGAGTYADDGAGACSTTGDGEAVMRLCLAKSAVEWMRTGALPEDAARAAVRHMFTRVNGTGGIILVGADGRVGWARTTRTMTWAAMLEGWAEPRAGA